MGELSWGWLTELWAAQFPAILLLRKALREPTSERPVMIPLPDTMLPQVAWAHCWMNRFIGSVVQLHGGGRQAK